MFNVITVYTYRLAVVKIIKYISELYLGYNKFRVARVTNIIFGHPTGRVNRRLGR